MLTLNKMCSSDKIAGHRQQTVENSKICYIRNGSFELNLDTKPVESNESKIFFIYIHIYET